MELLWEIAGWAGAAAILSAYLSVSMGWLKAGKGFQTANLLGAVAFIINGTFHGGDRTMPQSGALRPVPGWAQHRMPIPGLYQTGGTTHPGGSITGAPGRNAAMVLLGDLGTSIEEVVDAGRARAGSH